MVVLGEDDTCGPVSDPSITKNSSGAIYGAVPTFDVVNPRRLTILEIPKSDMHGTPCLLTRTFCYVIFIKASDVHEMNRTCHFQVSVDNVILMKELQT